MIAWAQYKDPRNRDGRRNACCSYVWATFAAVRPLRACCGTWPRGKRLQLALEIDSAGTADYHIGAPPDPRSQRAALRRAIDISGLRARQVSADDFARFDLILAMDRENLRALQSPAAA